MAANKWWCVASLMLCLAVAAAAARDAPRNDCDTATFAVPAAGQDNGFTDKRARAVDEANAADAFVGRTGRGGGMFRGVHGPLGGGVAGFGPFGGAVAGAGPFGGFGGGGGLGGGGGGGGGGGLP
jgi:hypothetical protein